MRVEPARERTVSQERTEAVVLRGVDFSETSRIVTFLTPERGRLACMATGVRRPKSGMGGLLDTFNRVELVYYWKDSRTVQRMGEVTLLDGFSGIKRDLDKTMLAAFPLEIAYKVAHENEPSHELFETLLRGMESFAAWQGDPKTHTAWNALHLISAAGYAPAIDTCAACGRAMKHAAGFSYEGGATCASCRADRRLSECAQEALRAMAGAPDACPEIEGGAEVFEALGRYIARQLDSDLRSLRVIGDVCGRA